MQGELLSGETKSMEVNGQHSHRSYVCCPLLLMQWVCALIMQHWDSCFFCRMMVGLLQCNGRISFALFHNVSPATSLLGNRVTYVTMMQG